MTLVGELDEEIRIGCPLADSVLEQLHRYVVENACAITAGHLVAVVPAVRKLIAVVVDGYRGAERDGVEGHVDDRARDIKLGLGERRRVEPQDDARRRVREVDRFRAQRNRLIAPPLLHSGIVVHLVDEDLVVPGNFLVAEPRDVEVVLDCGLREVVVIDIVRKLGQELWTFRSCTLSDLKGDNFITMFVTTLLLVFETHT